MAVTLRNTHSEARIGACDVLTNRFVWTNNTVCGTCGRNYSTRIGGDLARSKRSAPPSPLAPALDGAGARLRHRARPPPRPAPAACELPRPAARARRPAPGGRAPPAEEPHRAALRRDRALLCPGAGSPRSARSGLASHRRHGLGGLPAGARRAGALRRDAGLRRGGRRGEAPLDAVAQVAVPLPDAGGASPLCRGNSPGRRGRDCEAHLAQCPRERPARARTSLPVGSDLLPLASAIEAEERVAGIEAEENEEGRTS